ncbi:MAG: hypothetical protein WKF90_09940 [Pyrinomonadaceae bacterium]|jgi:hypothetical protein
MSRLAYSVIESKNHLHQRIMASLRVQASWTDRESGNLISVAGLTENLGENSALVNLDILPPVGSQVRLQIFDEDKAVIDIPTEVIRVERDPGKPLAALSIVENVKKWKEHALSAAQSWVTRHWQLNYEEEWVN